MNDHTLLFIGGLHKSGTSLLHRCLRGHPRVSGFNGTGVPRDEGQHLQDVYPPAFRLGGPGNFGFHPASHLTEASDLASDKTAQRLVAQWSKHWEIEKPVRVEKSPPNLLKTRFLQALFPEAHFVILLRHPIAVTLATRKWRPKMSLARLMEHWLVCHEIYATDRPFLARVVELRYEDFVARPDASIERVFSCVGLEPKPCAEIADPTFNQVRFEEWRRLPASTRNRLIMDFDLRLQHFGYSLSEF